MEKQFKPSSEDVFETLLPGKAGELEAAKLPAPARMVIYLLDGTPLLIDYTGK